MRISALIDTLIAYACRPGDLVRIFALIDTLIADVCKPGENFCGLNLFALIDTLMALCGQSFNCASGLSFVL